MEKESILSKNKTENYKFFIVIIIAVISFSSLAILVIKINDNSMKYEYLDFYDNWGTSNDCGEVKKGTISCLVNDNYVPVKQYSKIDKKG